MNAYTESYSKLKPIEEETIETFFPTNSRSNERPGKIFFGGEKYFRAIAKIALNYLLYIKPGCDYSKHITDVIKGQVSTGKYVFYYYPNHYRIHQISKDEISHLIHIVGDKGKEMLYCYLELFNTKNFIVVLDERYIGNFFEETYCYDLLKNEEVNKQVKIRLTKQHLNDTSIISDQHKKRISNRLNKVMGKIDLLFQQRRN